MLLMMALLSLAKNLTTWRSLSQDISVVDLFADIISKNMHYIHLWKQRGAPLASDNWSKTVLFHRWQTQVITW